jgi:hypothetical protein
MSDLLGSITGVLERIFETLLPSWDELSPVPPELAKPFEPPEEVSKEEKEGESDYEIALAYQNTESR